MQAFWNQTIRGLFIRALALGHCDGRSPHLPTSLTTSDLHLKRQI